MFICGAKDFHAMDKYFRLVEEIGTNQILLVTDTLSGEGQKSLLNSNSNYSKLILIDEFTLNSISKFGNIIRNLIKLLLLPLQAYILRNKWKRIKPKIVHATPIYYMVLAFMAGIPYIGTPQAGEIVDRSKGNIIYRFFAKLALNKAKCIIVDSQVMSLEIKRLFNLSPKVIKNGFDINYALSFQKKNFVKKRLLSIRGLQPNYQLVNLIQENKGEIAIDFVYPFKDKNYFLKLKYLSSREDTFWGKLDKTKLYNLMSKALLTISIPDSDSSPRSVYEAIFCGSIVAVTDLPFLKELPECMLKRLYIIKNLSNHWLKEAINFAELNYHKQYVPSQEALNFCDQKLLTKKIINDIYGF